MAIPNNNSHNDSNVCSEGDVVVDLLFEPEAAEAMGYSRAELIYISVFLPLLLLVGLVLNGAFLFVVHRVATMKTITNIYLVNVAIADILFLASVLIYKLTKLSTSVVVKDVSGLGPTLSIILVTMANITRFSSLGFISAVTWERFCAVCRPHSRRTSETHAMVVTTTVWVIAVILSTSIIPSYGVYFNMCMMWPESEEFGNWPDYILVTGMVAPWTGVYSNIVQTIPFFVTFAINVYLYVRIITGLDVAAKMVSRQRAGGSSNVDAALRAQTIRMLVVNGVAYFVCLALFQFLSLYKTITLLVDWVPAIPPKQGKIVLDVARTLEYLNSVINPLIYTVMSKRYRDAFKLVIRCQDRPNRRRRWMATSYNSMLLSNVKVSKT